MFVDSRIAEGNAGSEFCSPSGYFSKQFDFSFADSQLNRGKPGCARDLSLEGDAEAAADKRKFSTDRWDGEPGDNAHDSFEGDHDLQPMSLVGEAVTHPEMKRATGGGGGAITHAFPRVKLRRASPSTTSGAGADRQSPAGGLVAPSTTFESLAPASPAGKPAEAPPGTPPTKKDTSTMRRPIKRAYTAPPSATEIPAPPIDSWKDDGNGRGYVTNDMAMLIGTGHLAPVPKTPTRTPGPPLPQSGYEFSPGWACSPAGRAMFRGDGAGQPYPPGNGAGMEFSPGLPMLRRTFRQPRGEDGRRAGEEEDDDSSSSHSDASDTSDSRRHGTDLSDSQDERDIARNRARPNRRFGTARTRRGQRRHRRALPDPSSPPLSAIRRSMPLLGRAQTEPILASPAGFRGGSALDLASPPRPNMFAEDDGDTDGDAGIMDHVARAWNSASTAAGMSFLQGSNRRARPSRGAEPILSGFPRRSRTDSIDSLPRRSTVKGEFTYLGGAMDNERGEVDEDDDEEEDDDDEYDGDGSNPRRRGRKPAARGRPSPSAMRSPEDGRRKSQSSRTTPMSRRRTPTVRARAAHNGDEDEDEDDQLPTRTRKTPVRALDASQSSPSSPASATASGIVDPISETPTRAVPRALAGVLRPGAEGAGSTDAQFTRQEAMQQVMNAVRKESRPTDLPACHCSRSQCLKLYCECFATGAVCDPDQCKCVQCRNLPDFKEDRTNAVKHVLRRNPKAFQSKISASWDQQQQQHVRGCRCRNSHCVKKYCECYRAGVVCSQKCVCVECKNLVARVTGTSESVSPARSGGKAPSMGSPGAVSTASMNATTPRRRRGRSSQDKASSSAKRRRTGSPSAGAKVWVDHDGDDDEEGGDMGE